jgi:DNA-binding beta-propeller fold protein YncE
MQRSGLSAALAIALFTSATLAWQGGDGPYKVLRTAKVGGEGGFDYIYADVAGRRLYIPRGGTRAVPATDTAPAVAAVPGRITAFDLDTLEPVGQIPDSGGNGVAVDPKSGHGFSSSKPVTMFDTKTLTVIKKIDVGAAQPDGIYFDAFNDRVYVFSHPTKDATVIDSKEGTVLGTIDLGGVPEQAVSDGKGNLYVVMQDAQGSVTAVDARTMKATAHYPFGENGGCNGLALDAKNRVLFASCARIAAPVAPPQPGQTATAPATTPPQPGQALPPPQPMMVIMSADDGKIITKLPLAGGSDGAVFNPATMETFSSHSNGTMTIVKEKGPASFEVEQNLQTMLGARTLTLDSKTNHLFVMSVERGPAPPPPAGGGRGAQAPAIPGSFSILVIGK